MPGFLYKAKPPTGVISAGSPIVKALGEKSHWKKSTCGSIPRKASQTVTKLAMCITPVRLRCCSSRPHLLRSPHRNQCMGYPNLRSWMVRKETTSSGRGCGNSSPPGTLQCATSYGGRNPFVTNTSSTNAFMVDDLQSDISVSSSLLPHSLPFLETSVALRNAHDKKEERRRWQMKNRQKNGTKTLSLLLLKEKGTTVREGCADRGSQNDGARISLFSI